MMKKIVVMVFVALFFCFNSYGSSQQPGEPTKTEGKMLPAPGKPTGPGPMPGSPQEMAQGEMGEIFFAAGTISSDGKFLFIILDRFLLQYVLPTLELKRKVELNIAVAPVTPTISISKDSKYLYIICNGILYQIDATKLKIEKQIKITP